MIKLLPQTHNPDIAHCPGTKSVLCKNCLRRALLELWISIPPENSETVMLMPPRADRYSCPCHIVMPTGYTDGRTKPVQVRYNGRSTGNAI